MGYRTFLNGSAKCPLFERVVYSGENYKIAGVQCESISGFSASVIVRTAGRKGLRELKRMYCDNLRGYHDCPYYRAYMSQEKAGE